MLVGVLHCRHHINARRFIPNPPCPTYIHTNDVGTNKISVKSHDFIILNNAGTTFLKPRVGAWARGQKAGLNPFSTSADIFSM